MTKIMTVAGETVDARHIRRISADGQKPRIDLYQMAGGRWVVCFTEAGDTMPHVDPDRTPFDYGFASSRRENSVIIEQRGRAKWEREQDALWVSSMAGSE